MVKTQSISKLYCALELNILNCLEKNFMVGRQSCLQCKVLKEANSVVEYHVNIVLQMTFFPTIQFHLYCIL